MRSFVPKRRRSPQSKRNRIDKTTPPSVQSQCKTLELDMGLGKVFTCLGIVRAHVHPLDDAIVQSGNICPYRSLRKVN